MRTLTIPFRLRQEFATVEALWRSTGETKRVDALVLSWVKYEKQLRRLFCFLLYQHPRITDSNIREIVDVLAKNRGLNPDTLMAAIKALGVTSVPKLLGSRYNVLSREMSRIKKYRNKLIHGQVTGQDIRSSQLEQDVLWIIEWIDCLATAAKSKFGYDGLERNTFKTAKAAARLVIAQFPFTTSKTLTTWLDELVNHHRCHQSSSVAKRSR